MAQTAPSQTLWNQFTTFLDPDNIALRSKTEPHDVLKVNNLLMGRFQTRLLARPSAPSTDEENLQNHIDEFVLVLAHVNHETLAVDNVVSADVGRRIMKIISTAFDFFLGAHDQKKRLTNVWGVLERGPQIATHDIFTGQVDSLQHAMALSNAMGRLVSSQLVGSNAVVVHRQDYNAIASGAALLARRIQGYAVPAGMPHTVKPAHSVAENERRVPGTLPQGNSAQTPGQSSITPTVQPYMTPYRPVPSLQRPPHHLSTPQPTQASQVAPSQPFRSLRHTESNSVGYVMKNKTRRQRSDAGAPRAPRRAKLYTSAANPSTAPSAATNSYVHSKPLSGLAVLALASQKVTAAGAGVVQSKDDDEQTSIATATDEDRDQTSTDGQAEDSAAIDDDRTETASSESGDDAD